NFFDDPPLALDDYMVINAYRLGYRDLQACDDGRKRFLRSQSRNDARHPRRCQQAGPNLADRLKIQQRSRDANDDDDKHQQPADHLDAGFDSPTPVRVVLEKLVSSRHHRFHRQNRLDQEDRIGDNAGGGNDLVTRFLSKIRKLNDIDRRQCSAQENVVLERLSEDRKRSVIPSAWRSFGKPVEPVLYETNNPQAKAEYSRKITQSRNFRGDSESWKAANRKAEMGKNRSRGKKSSREDENAR